MCDGIVTGCECSWYDPLQYLCFCRPWHPFFGHFGHLQFEVAIYSDLNDKINNICKQSTPWYNFCHPSWSLMHVNMYFGYPCIHCLHMPFVYFPQRLLYHLAFILLTMSVHDEWYSRNASCPVNKITTFLFYFTDIWGIWYIWWLIKFKIFLDYANNQFVQKIFWPV